MGQSQDAPPRPKHYKPGSGTDRYVRFVEDWLDIRVPTIQSAILEALESNRRVVAVAANGVGKSYVAAAGAIAALYCNPNTTVNITSGSYGQLDDTIWKPIKSLHRNSQLPGRTLDNTRELRSGLAESWYLKCLSPQYPGDLEGRHNERMVYVIEEADKPGITREHIDSAESTITDEDDRMLVIANPPTDETNVVKALMESDKWQTLQFPSWESHNVQHPDDTIPGLVEESEIRENWEEWNNEAWSGLDAAISESHERTDLADRWYRRRAGIIPPESSDTWRPFSISDVREAWKISSEHSLEADTAAIDVARSGDETVLAGKHADTIKTHYANQGYNHVQQKKDLSDELDVLGGPETAVDAVGEGSGLADELNERFNITRYSNGAKPNEESEYYNCWAEALAHFGSFLERGCIDSRELFEQAKVAAQVIEFREKDLTSRGGGVIAATPKDKLKDALGKSPDHLDAALMANWLDMASTQTVTRRKGVTTQRFGGD